MDARKIGDTPWLCPDCARKLRGETYYCGWCEELTRRAEAAEKMLGEAAEHVAALVQELPTIGDFQDALDWLTGYRATLPPSAGERTSIPPDVMVQAYQDTVHKESDNSRPGRSANAATGGGEG